MSKNEHLDPIQNDAETPEDHATTHEIHRLSSAEAREFLSEELEETTDELAAVDIEYSNQHSADDAEEITIEEASPHAERLHKLIARAGLASRRGAEEIIAQGRVLINGIVASEVGRKADPTRDRISVDGQPLRVPTTTTVVLMHKPLGVVSTRKDPEGRTTVTHLLPEKLKHLHPIGRLDYDTSGLLLLTDDGSLTQLLTHPSHGVEKVYWARVRGTVTVGTLKTLEAGIYLEDGKTAPCKARVRAQTENNALVQLTLREGRNRQVRRMLEAVGHQVRALRRVRLGGLGLDELLPGSYRVLLPGEVHALRKAAEAKPKSRPKPSAPKRPFSNAENAETAPRPMTTRTSSTRSSPARPNARPSERPSDGRDATRFAARAESNRNSSGYAANPRVAPSRFAPDAANASSSRPRFNENAPRRATSRSANTERFSERAPLSRPNSPRTNESRSSESRSSESRSNASRSDDSRFSAERPSATRSNAARPNASREGFQERETASRATPNGRFTGTRAPREGFDANERAFHQRDSSERFSTKRDAPRETERSRLAEAPRERFAPNERLDRQKRQSAQSHPVARRVAQSFEQAAPPRDRRSPASARTTETRSNTAARPNSYASNSSASPSSARPNYAARAGESARPNTANRATAYGDAPPGAKPGKQAKPTRPPKAARVFAANTAQAAKNARNAAENAKFSAAKTPRAASPRGAANAGAAKTEASQSRPPKAKTNYDKPVARRGERAWGQKTRKRA